jgi:hypothetical protein
VELLIGGACDDLGAAPDPDTVLAGLACLDGLGVSSRREAVARHVP